MQLYTTESYADINFSASEVQIIKPSDDVLGRSVALDELSMVERMAAKETIFENYLQRTTLAAPSRNAILDEHNDFALSIQTGCAPSVTGADGARAVDIAMRVVEAIERHEWDGLNSKAWRIGPQALIEPHILPLPRQNRPSHEDRRRAG